MAINLTITTSIDAGNREIAQANLPVANTTLTAVATDPTDAGAIFEYNWHIIDAPATATTTLSAQTGASITVDDIDVWGTYRIFCIVRNTVTLEQSPTNPLAAHKSHFVDLAVVSNNKQLQKPAKTQRDWHDEYWKLVDVVEAFNVAGLPFCPAETYEKTGDILIYDTGCNPDGFHAINYGEPTFTDFMPYASRGVGALWGTALDTINGTAFEDNIHHPGLVGIADLYDYGKGNGYMLDNHGLSLGDSLAQGRLLSIAMTTDRFSTSLIGNQGVELSLITVDQDNAAYGFYPPLINDTELATVNGLVGANKQVSVLQNALTTYNNYQIKRTSIGALGDVDLTTAAPTDGQILVWNSSAGTGTVANGTGVAQITGAWVPANETGGVQDKIQEDTTIVEVIETQADGSDAAVTFTINGESAFKMDNPVGHDNDNAVLRPFKDCLNDLGSTGNRFRDGHFCRDLYVNGNRVAVSAAGEMSITDSGSTSRSTPSYTGTPTANQILKYVGSAWTLAADSTGSAVGDARDIQLTDGSGNFVAANWQITTGDDFIPITDNAFDIGTSSLRVRKVWGHDANFSDDVAIGDNLTVSGTATVTEFIALQDHAFLNDNGSAGTLLFTAGDNGSVVGSITNSADEVIIKAETSGTEAKLSLQNSAASKISLLTQAKQSSAHTIELPSAAAGAQGDVVYVTDFGSNDTEIEFGTITQTFTYSTHVSIDADFASSFTSGNMNSFATDAQACLYWVKNTTGGNIDLKKTSIYCGEMKNITLGFTICKAASDAAAIANTWTSVGSEITLTNSSGADNTLGQAQAVSTSTTTVANGHYLGLALTDLPASNRNDKRIVITFECEKGVSIA